MYFQHFQYFPSEDDAWEASLWSAAWEIFSLIIPLMKGTSTILQIPPQTVTLIILNLTFLSLKFA